MNYTENEALTARERECLQLAATCTDKEIATQLGISVATVKTHLGAARRKLQVPVRRRPAARLVVQPVEAHPQGSTTPRSMSEAPTTPPFIPTSDLPVGAGLEPMMVREERATFGHQPRLTIPVEAYDDLTFRRKALWLLVTPLALAALILIVLAIFGEFDNRVLPHFYPHHRY